MAEKIIKVDWNSSISIKRAERRKALLESKGWNLKRTLYSGRSIYKLVYTNVKERKTRRPRVPKMSDYI